MTQAEHLKRRIATYPDAEARSVIHFLLTQEQWSVAQRLNLTGEQAREHVAARVLDYIAGIEPKLR